MFLFYIYITQLINNWYIKTWYLFRQMVLYIYKHSPGILLQTSLSKWLPLPSVSEWVSELASATSPHRLAPSFPDVSSHQWVKHIFAPEVEFHVHMQNDYGDSRCSDRYSIYIYMIVIEVLDVQVAYWCGKICRYVWNTMWQINKYIYI